MHPLVSFNRQIQPNLNANLSAVSSAAFYGRGIFTTLAIHRSKPFLWNLHEKRLQENASKIGFDSSEINFENVQDDLFGLITANRVNDGRARITLFDSGSSAVWQTETTRKIDVLIVTAERREKSKNNIKLTVSPFLVNSSSPLAAIKSCNYLEKVLALEAANTNGFDEAVRLNEREEIVSATMANVFWMKDKQIFTPALLTAALDGTTRQYLIELMKKNNLAVIETNSRLENLQTADEIFLTSAGLGVCSVQSLDSQILSNCLTLEIQTIFANLIENYV